MNASIAEAVAAKAAQHASGRLRIAVVTPELHRTGGTERATAEVVARLSREYRVCLFAHRWTPDAGADICFHRVPVLPWPGLLRFLSFYASASRQVDRAERKHGRFAAVYSPGANCRQVEVSTAWFCQARQLELFRSGKHRPPPATWMDRLKLLHRWSYAAVVARVEGRFYRSPRLRKVITQSQLLADDLKHFYNLPAERVEVAHGGVNVETFPPEQRESLREGARRALGLAPGQMVFLFIGNNWLIKGLFHVMRALAEVPNVLLLVVGVGAERPESWQRWSEQLGVAERIRYLPRRPDVIFYYAAADALVAPSVYDTFPLMPLEAMACGLPTIISGRTGTAEIVGPEDTLLVSRAENIPELVAAMRRMAEDAALRARLVANGFALVQKYPWDRIYGAVVKELQSVAGQKVTSANN
jgi:glycosyltransferase involved in cell wall biosynthesis